MLTAVAIVHIVVAILLIILVLVQDAKGGVAGGLMGGGGGSGSVFGATGGATFAAKATRWVGLIFAITCISLSYMTATRTDSVVDRVPVTPGAVPVLEETIPEMEGLDTPTVEE